MNTTAISSYLYQHNIRLTDAFLSQIDGHVVLAKRLSSEDVVVAGDTFPVRDSLKAAGYHWNAAEQAWVGSIRFDQTDSFVATLADLSAADEDKALGQIAVEMAALDMGSRETPSCVKFIESDLKRARAFAQDVRENGYIEHD